MNWRDIMLGAPEAMIRTLVVGVLAYVALIVLLRISGKRTLSKFNAFDFVVTIAIGSTLASVLLSESVALSQGVIAFAVLLGLQFIITWLSVRVHAIHSLVKSEPALLVYRGDYCDEALRRERVTRAELRAAARNQGYATLEKIEAAVLETDGTITFVTDAPDGTASTLQDIDRYPGPLDDGTSTGY